VSNNPYPVNSPSWNEWEKQVGRAPQEVPVVEDDDWELPPACGLEPEECESCQ
jgi:hypothetical protein